MPSLQGWTGRPWFQEVAKTAGYSVLLADSGTLFTNTGAGGSVTFTLPALASGFGGFWWFYATVAQNMVIAAPSNKLNIDGASNGTSGTYSTAGHIIGSFCMVCMNDLGTFYYLWNCGGTAVTTA